MTSTPESEDDDSGFHPWTEAGAVDLLEAADALAEAVRTHARALAALIETRSRPELFAASENLSSAALRYADAQFELTGYAFPFGVLHQFEEDDEEPEDQDDEHVVGSGLSVVSRQDFVVTDEEAVLGEGRAAYRSLWPDDPEAAAAEDVTHIGRALYQYAHRHGWDALEQIPGLEPVGAITVVQANEELLRGDPDEWPDEPFTLEAPVLHSQVDTYG